jgi:hypothetical protein
MCNYNTQRIEELKEKLAKIQLELAYCQAKEIISNIIENTVIIPNDYLKESFGTSQKIGFDWWDWNSSIATEKNVLKKISDKVSNIKEHYTASNLDWAKPLKQATKDYFAFVNSEKI